jgi:hypothetical protein
MRSILAQLPPFPAPFWLLMTDNRCHVMASLKHGIRIQSPEFLASLKAARQ